MNKYFCLSVLCLMALVSKVSAQETASQDTAQGSQFYEAQNYVEAEKSLQAAIKLDPNYAPAYQLLGNVYVLQGRKEDALAEYQKSLSLQPNNPALSTYVQSLQPTRQVAWAPTPSVTAQPSVIHDDRDLDKAHAIFGVSGGPAFWGGIANEDYSYESEIFGTAVGGGIYVGCQFDRHFSVSINLSQYTFPYTITIGGLPYVLPAGEAYSLQEWQLMMVCKYIMGSSGVRPYISLGMGTNLSLAVESGLGYSTNYATTAPLFEFGVGTIVPLSHDWDFFVEANYELAFFIADNLDQNYSFIPINIGIQYNLP